MLATDLSQMAGCSDTAKSLKVKSAINPGLWLVAIGVPILLGAAYAFRDRENISTALVVAALAIIGAVVLSYCYFVLFHPEKLQSEDYQLRHMAMQVYQKKTEHIVPTEAGMAHIANPAARSIEQ